MTHEEAINILSEESCSGCAYLDMDNTCIGSVRCFEAKRMAIEALEKQIPKKVYEGEINEYMGYYCPACHSEIVEDGEWEYCMHCGQRIDWGEEE